MSKVIPCRFQKYCRDIKSCRYLHLQCKFGNKCKPLYGYTLLLCFVTIYI